MDTNGAVPGPPLLTGASGRGWQEEEAEALVDALLENNAMELLVQRLVAFDESVDEEAAAVFNALSIVENLVEVRPPVAEAVMEKTKVGGGRQPPGARVEQVTRCHEDSNLWRYT